MKKFKPSDRTSPVRNRNQPMIKVEYPSVSRTEQHAEIEQDPYHNHMENLGQSFEYLQTHSGMDEIRFSNSFDAN